MSEHTPLTEAERTEVAHAIWFGAENGPIAADGELAATIERIIAARTSTAAASPDCIFDPPGDCISETDGIGCRFCTPDAYATADTELRERVEHLVIMLERGERVPYWAIVEARAALDATAAPTADTGARDE